MGRGVLGWIWMYCIHRLYYGRLVGVSFREDAGSYCFAPVGQEKLDFYALAGIIEEISLLLSEQDGWTGQTGWYWGGIQGPELEGKSLGAPHLALKVRQGAGSGRCHQFYRCCRGHGAFVSVQQKNHNTLHTNTNYFIVEDGTKSTYNTILI